MATEKQIAANRANANKSTGPKTAEGKANLRFNNLRHGLRTDALILPCEDRRDFDNFLRELEAEWQPETPSAHMLVEQMAIAQWKLRRVDRTQRAILINDPDGVEHIPVLDRLSRQEARLERSFFRASKELDRLKRNPLKLPRGPKPAADSSANVIRFPTTPHPETSTPHPEPCTERSEPGAERSEPGVRPRSHSGGIP